MTFKAKLSKQGNSYCIYVPIDVRTKLDLHTEYEWNVRTDNEQVRTPRMNENGTVALPTPKESAEMNREYKPEKIVPKSNWDS